MDATLARKLACTALARYWPRGPDPVERLPLANVPWPSEEALPPLLALVSLPPWAHDLGVEGALLAPAHRIAVGSGAAWRRTDWLGAACWFLHGLAERAHERRYGAIHSYSCRLKHWDARIWDRAWANRIALFLRRWAARNSGETEAALLGPNPRAEILLTHDIDAVAMTLALRFKQASFHGLSAIRQLSRGKPGGAAAQLLLAVRFAGRSGDLWHIDQVASLVRERGMRSHFFVYGRPRGRSLKLAILDPQYDIARTPLGETLHALHSDGFCVGLHQSFDSWRDAGAMTAEKRRIENNVQVPIDSCRQHWLRFSWADTWAAQERAGFALDATLGFNDRPGFRNGAALRMRPWSEARGAELAIESVPMVLMDSQLYDYAGHDEASRAAEIDRWIDEVRAVGGVASVIWHPHTLGSEYGWRSGFEALLARVAALQP